MEDPATIWKYISGIEATVIVSMVGWWIKKERPELAKVFKEKEEELKKIISDYSNLCKKYQAAVDKVSARLIDVYQERRALIIANQKVIDLIAKGKISIEKELKDIIEETNISLTRIIDNGNDKDD